MNLKRHDQTLGMGLAAVLAVAGGLSAWGAIALQASDWVARGADTLASTPANWNGNAIPTGSMRFSSGAYGATVTFDRFYTVGGHVWTGTDVAGKMYTPSTGAVNPFIWEATDPSCGINQTSSNLIVADNASQNAALEIRGGTYKTTGNFNVATAGSAWLNIKNATITVGGIAYFGSGGTAEVNFEEGSISTVGDLVMANASGTKARLTVGSGDPARVAKFIVPINKWAQMCGNAAGDGAMTLKAGGEFHCGYLCSRNPNAVLTRIMYSPDRPSVRDLFDLLKGLGAGVGDINQAMARLDQYETNEDQTLNRYRLALMETLERAKLLRVQKQALEDSFEANV